MENTKEIAEKLIESFNNGKNATIEAYGYALYHNAGSLTQFNKRGSRRLKPQKVVISLNEREYLRVAKSNFLERAKYLLRVFSFNKRNTFNKGKEISMLANRDTPIKLFFDQEDMLQSYSNDLESYKESFREYKEAIEKNIEEFEGEMNKILLL